MGNLWSNLFTFINLSSHLFSQFGSVEISFDDRLLRNDEKQVLLPLKEDIKRFFLATSWDEEYIDLDIPLYIQLIFQRFSARHFLLMVQTYVILIREYNSIIVLALISISIWFYSSRFLVS